MSKGRGLPKKSWAKNWGKGRRRAASKKRAKLPKEERDGKRTA